MANRIIAAILRKFKQWDRRQPFTKRQQFVGITLILTIGLMLTQLVSLDFRYPMVALLSIVSYLLCAFGLRDDLKGHEWLTLLSLPMLFTAAVSVFYFLLPTRWLTRLPIAVLYAIGMYALLLTENIYNVAVVRTIALLRAAHSIGFLLTLITYFLLVQTILAYRQYPWTNALLLGLVTYPLTVQILWATTLETRIGKRVKDLSVAVTLACVELAWILSFFPVRTTLFALFLTTAFYGLVGMGQQYISERLYRRTVTEFFSVVLIVFCILLITINFRTSM